MSHDSDYVCPQCGPAPEGPDAHAERAHTWPIVVGPTHHHEWVVAHAEWISVAAAGSITRELAVTLACPGCQRYITFDAKPLNA